MTNLDEKMKIINEIHERAHRNAINNYLEAKEKYFWPEMKRDFIKKNEKLRNL